MKLLKAIMGNTTEHGIRIREQLRVEDIQNQIERNRLKWFEHVNIIDKHRIPKKGTGHEDEWKRSQGQTTNMVAT
jgi:hypothetical protein